MRLVAAIVVFTVVFVLATFVKILMDVLGDKFLPILGLSAAVAIMFVVLDILSGWGQAG